MLAVIRLQEGRLSMKKYALLSFSMEQPKSVLVVCFSAVLYTATWIKSVQFMCLLHPVQGHTGQRPMLAVISNKAGSTRRTDRQLQFMLLVRNT